jgi:hypothetical protein
MGLGIRLSVIIGGICLHTQKKKLEETVKKAVSNAHAKLVN